jgi:hypothetical protein
MIKLMCHAAVVLFLVVAVAERTLVAQLRPPEGLRWSVTVDDAKDRGPRAYRVFGTREFVVVLNFYNTTDNALALDSGEVTKRMSVTGRPSDAGRSEHAALSWTTSDYHCASGGYVERELISDPR